MNNFNNKKVDISIIIPVYNSEDKISKCLNSIINQTYKNIEIILVNDGSTDNSLDICEEYLLKDDRIKIINKKNGGVSSARNIGITNANGEYIAFVDSDDFVDKNMCKEMIEAIRHDNADLVIASYYTIFDGNIKAHICNSKVYNNIHEMKDDFELIYLDCFLNSPWNKLFKKEKIKKYFNESMHYFEDYYFNLEYIDNIKKITMIDKPYYYYTEDTPQSLTKLYREDIFDVFPIIYNKQIEFCNKYFGDKYDILIKSSLIYGLYNSIQKLVYSENPKIYKINTMKKWSNNKYILNALENRELEFYWGKKSIQYKLAFKFIKLKKFNKLYYMLYIKKILTPYFYKLKLNFIKG